MTKNGIFIIDEKYRIQFCNDTAKKLFPGVRTGQFFYELFYTSEQFGGDKAFTNLMTSANEPASFTAYSQYENSPFRITVSDYCAGKSKNYLLEVEKCKSSEIKNVYIVKQAYEEIFELDPLSLDYQLAYATEQKYAAPPRSGSLTNEESLFKIAERLIHPSDVRRFIAFFKRENIENIVAEKNNTPTNMTYRRKMQSGEYGWVMQVVAPDINDETGEKYLAVFTLDINEQKKQELNDIAAEFRQVSEFDTLTGLSNSQLFSETAARLMSAGSGSFFLAYIDIPHFKLFNDWYGYHKGDRMLVSFSKRLSEVATEFGGIAGSLGADDFVLLMKYSPGALEALRAALKSFSEEERLDVNFAPVMGLLELKEKPDSFRAAFDMAYLAVAAAKRDYLCEFAWYTPDMRDKLEDEQTLFSDIIRGFEAGEFFVALQPKCNIRTGHIVGLEALVRWKHPEKGIISANEFIALLEKNNFIYTMDKFVWEETCRIISSQLVLGTNVVPCSVNVSRLDIYEADIAEVFTALVEKHRIPPEYIEIEITESAYVSDYSLLMKAVAELHRRGFTILMDDFGSGYSSLNMLKDIEVDIVKIDMKFLDLTVENIRKGSGILASIVQMAKWLDCAVVAEGVENVEQAEFLLSLGCDYAQGNYFYRAMSAPDYEKLLSSGRITVDKNGMNRNSLKEFSISELYRNDFISESLLSNILGSVAVYEMRPNGNMILTSVNREYYRMMKIDPISLYENRTRLFEFVDKRDRAVVRSTFQLAVINAASGAQCSLRRTLYDGKIVWIRLHAFFLRQSNGSKYFYCTLTDITEQKKYEELLEESQRCINAVLGISEKTARGTMINTNTIASSQLFSNIAPIGMAGVYCGKEFPIFFLNDKLLRLLGYESYSEFSRETGAELKNIIHEESRESFLADFPEPHSIDQKLSSRFRLRCKNKADERWVLATGVVVQSNEGVPALVAALVDVTENVAVHKQAETTRRELSILIEDIPSGYAKLVNAKDPTFTFVSRRFLEILGYTEEEYAAKGSKKLSSLVGRLQTERIVKRIDSLRQGESITEEIPVECKNGSLTLIMQLRAASENGEEIFYGTFLDVTEQIRLRKELRAIIENVPGDLFSVVGDRIESYNKNLTKQLGFIGKSAEELKEVTQTTRDILDKIKKKKGNFDETYKVQTGEGGTEWIRTMTARRDDGSIYGISTNVSAMMKLQLQLDSIIKNLPGDIVETRAHNKVYRRELYNIGLASVLGYSSDVYRALVDEYTGLIGDEDRERLHQAFIQLGEDPSRSIGVDVRLKRADGSWAWANISTSFKEKEPNGERVYNSIVTDISALKTAEENIRLSRARLRTVIRQANLLTWEYDLESKKLLFHEHDRSGIRRHFGDGELKYSPDFPFDMLRRGVIDEATVERISVFVSDVCAADAGITRELLLSAGGEPKLWLEINGEAVVGVDGKVTHIVGCTRDITVLKQAEISGQLDGLTGVFNRKTAIERINALIKTPRRGDTTSAMLLFDIDYFKNINDTYGHIFGDAVLSEVAQSMLKMFRTQDVVCRLGGDEFMVYCVNMSPEQASEAAQRMCDSASELVFVAANGIKLSFSIGVSLLGQDGNTFEELYENADIALYQAKTNGRNQFRLYSPDMPRSRIETGLAETREQRQKMYSGLTSHLLDYVFKVVSGSGEAAETFERTLELIARFSGAESCAFFCSEIGCDFRWSVGEKEKTDYLGIIASAESGLRERDFCVIKPDGGGTRGCFVFKASVEGRGAGYLVCEFVKLPEFTDEQLEDLKNSCDLLGSSVRRRYYREEQKKINSLLTGIIDADPHMVFVVRENFDIIYCNPAAIKTFPDKLSASEFGVVQETGEDSGHFSIIRKLKESGLDEYAGEYSLPERNIGGIVRCRAVSFGEDSLLYLIICEINPLEAEKPIGLLG